MGLYMSPPENAVVVSTDERTQIQALSRTGKDQPLAPKNPQQQTHDYKRNGTTTLFATLDVLTGKLSANAFYQKHTNVELVDFRNRGAEVHPGLICTSSVKTTRLTSTRTCWTGWRRALG